MSTDEMTDKQTREQTGGQADSTLDDNSIRAEVTTALGRIAPEFDAGAGDAGANLFDEFDIDSIDFLNLITRLSKRYDVPMPERDYPRMHSINALVTYLSQALSVSRDSSSG